MSQPDEILALLRERDERGLRLLFEEYGGALNAIIARIVDDRRVAEEVLQDTLLKAWSKIELYDPAQAGLFAWLMGIARHAAIDRVRLRGYREMRTSKTFDAPVHDSKTDAASTAGIDADALTAGLDAKYLDVLEKVYFEGHSAHSAAEALDIPVGTVKTRLRKALQILRVKVHTDKRFTLGFLLASLAALPLL